MDAIGHFYKQNPVHLPVHVVSVVVETKAAACDGEIRRQKLTVLRLRVHDLLNLLANVDFERLVINPATFELHDTMQLLALDGPFCPQDRNADVTDAIPYVSVWHEQNGRARKVDNPRPFRAHLVMRVTQQEKEPVVQQVERKDLASRVRMIVGKSDFAEIVVMPGDSSDSADLLRVTDKQLLKLADLFDLVDVDGSGEIVLEEMRIVLKDKGYSDDFVEHLFYHMDLNKDKRVKRDEFYQALRFLPVEIFSSDKAVSDEHLMRYFDEFDADRNGTLSWPEFHEALLKRGMSESFIKKYFADLDLDSNKTISRNEYARCIGLRWNKD